MNTQSRDGSVDRRASPREFVSGDTLYQAVRALHRRMDEAIDARKVHALAIAELRGDLKKLSALLLTPPAGERLHL